jgi:hypothetical protein
MLNYVNIGNELVNLDRVQYISKTKVGTAFHFAGGVISSALPFEEVNGYLVAARHGKQIPALNPRECTRCHQTKPELDGGFVHPEKLWVCNACLAA